MRDIEWAKNEIELALKKDDKLLKKCYKTVLKIFKLFNADKFSWEDIVFIRRVIDALFNDYPLTPIEDNDDEWIECFGINENPAVKVFQHKRRGSFWKDVFPDGTIKYKDNERNEIKVLDSDNNELKLILSE